VVRDAPDALVGVVDHQQRTIAGHGDAHWPAPDFLLVLAQHPSRREILVAARGLALRKWDADDLVAGADASIGRAAQRRKGTAAIAVREALPLAEDQSHHRRR